MATEVKQLEVTVRLMGKAGELIKFSDSERQISRDLKVKVSEVTPRNIIAEIAKQNSLIAEQIIRDDGIPRSSTKILINGQPPKNLDMALSTKRVQQGEIIIVIFTDEIIIVIVVPCDG